MMYREDFRDRHDDYAHDLEPSRYLPLPRDLYYEERRERGFEELERKRYGPPSLDDPYFRHPLEDLEPPPLPRRGRPLESPMDDEPLQDLNTGVIMCGSVIVIPASPFEPKPKTRERPPLCKTVFVGSLPDNTANKHLQDVFSKCGKVLDIRVSKGRNFGHVQFEAEEGVDRALMLSGCRIRVGPSNSLSDTGKIHVDFAQPRTESEISKRMEQSEPLVFNSSNVTAICSELHYEDSFFLACKNIMLWIERGSCNSNTTTTFFGLISSCNTHCRKIGKKVKELEKEDADWIASKRRHYDRLHKECKVVEDVMITATTQKTAWDGFTKPQRKSITQWKEYATATDEEMKMVLCGGPDEGEPAAKKVKVSTPEPSPYKKGEMEALISRHEATLRKKETQIMQLNTLITQFKKQFPKEWENMIGGEGKNESPPKAKKPSGSDEEEMDESSGSLSAVAAAYAKMRNIIGSSADDAQESTFTEAEVAIITVLSTFLTVNPLGATVDEITAYFNKYNPALTSVYLTSLLCRLPQVFQLSQQSSEDEKKWWFLGFQTCCTQAHYLLGNTDQGGNNSPGSGSGE